MISKDIAMETLNPASTSPQVSLVVDLPSPNETRLTVEQGDAEAFSKSIKERAKRAFDALVNRNIEEFRCALKNGADPLAMDDEGNLSVYEKALQTSGASQFVEEGLKAGCDPNHIMTKSEKIYRFYKSGNTDDESV